MTPENRVSKRKKPRKVRATALGDLVACPKRERTVRQLGEVDPVVCNGLRAGQLIEAEALLAELLTALGLERAQRALGEIDNPDLGRKRRLAAGGMPGARSIERYVHELVALLPELEELVAELRNLRRKCAVGELPTGAYIDERKLTIAGAWNEAVKVHKAVTLPTLCEVCGIPLPLRKPDTRKKRKVQSTVCDAHKNARIQARRRKKRSRG